MEAEEERGGEERWRSKGWDRFRLPRFKNMDTRTFYASLMCSVVMTVTLRWNCRNETAWGWSGSNCGS